jgi:hypothetical protein
MPKPGFTARAEQLAKGEITFDAFVRSTLKDWERMAAVLHRKWHLPPGVTEDDLRQELLLQAWRAWSRTGKFAYDPTKNTPERFLVFKAHARTMNYIHGQRGAGQHRPEAVPSNVATPISWTEQNAATDGAKPQDLLDRFDGTRFHVDRRIEACEMLGKVARALDEDEARCLGNALAHEGQIDEADAERIRALLAILTAVAA